MAQSSSVPPRLDPNSSSPISANSWQLIASAILANRLVVGWVYWGGFSRRFIYSPKKIDPDSAGYLANKLVHAMPGIPFGFGNIVSWMLDHGALLHAAVIGFSLVELLVGLAMIFGFATRFFSLVGIGLSIFLMLIFGWMGTTCLDEWTMAACSFAMSAVVMLTGAGRYSIDNLLVKSGKTERTPWLAWVTSGPIPISQGRFHSIAALLGVVSIVFTVFFYGFYFNAIYSPLAKRYNNLHPRVTMSDAVLSNGELTVNTYMDRGPDTQGAYIVSASLAPKAEGSTPIFNYDVADLKDDTKVQIVSNRYAPWSTCAVISYGIRCQLGSRATLSFAAPANTSASDLVLTLTDVEGKTFTVPVQSK